MAVFCSSGVVTELCPKPGDTVSFHTQILVNGMLEIPEQKPDIEELLNTAIEITVHKALTITVKAPVGRKVLVAGTLDFGVEYIADVPDQKVHFAHYELPFQALVKNNDGSLLPFDFDLNLYNVHICIEHVEVHEVDGRSFLKEIVLLIWLQPKAD
ncbi:MAG: DUF3794 domain-containing protein [Desulfotomaculaceae bacterium]